MKIIKRVAHLVLIFCLLAAIPTISFAEKKNQPTPNLDKMEKTKNPYILYDSTSDQYYDTRDEGFIGEIYRVEGGVVVESVDVESYIEENEEYVEDIKIPNTEDEITPLGGPVVYSRYTESTNTEVRLFGERVSIVQENPGPGDDRYALGYSTSESHSGNISLTSEKTSALKLGVGYTYTVTASITSSHTMTIPAGYSGYWRFDPKMRKTMGTMQNYLDGVLMSTEDVRVLYPTRLNGDLDGWLVAVKTPL